MIGFAFLYVCLSGTTMVRMYGRPLRHTDAVISDEVGERISFKINCEVSNLSSIQWKFL